MSENFLERMLFGGKLGWVFEIDTRDEDVSRRGRMLILSFMAFLFTMPFVMLMSFITGTDILVAFIAELTIIALFVFGIWLTRLAHVAIAAGMVGVCVTSVVSYAVTFHPDGWAASAWFGLAGVIMTGFAGSTRSLMAVVVAALGWAFWTGTNLDPAVAERLLPTLVEYALGILLFSGMVWLFAWSDRRSFLRELNARKEQENLVAALEQSNLMAEEAREVAEAANLAKSRFLANMSHELRTPLNAIIGYSEMIAEDVGDGVLEPEVVLEDLDRIRNAGGHLLHVISDVLDLSKIEAGKMTLERVDFDVSALAHEVVDTLHPMIIARENTITCQIQEGLSMSSDSSKVRAILYNLLSNATKFTEDGELRVSLTEIPARSSIEIIIEDSGIGMSDEVQERVFEAFVQADNSTTREYGGTGLGLALTRRLVTMLGGTIELESAVGAGTLFTIELPLRLDSCDE